MKYQDIKVGETYNVRVKVEYKESDNENGDIATVPVDKNGKKLTPDWAYYSPSDAPAFSPITHENGTKNTESAPKYDPCRLFRKGDIVTPKVINGRFFDKFTKELVGLKCEVLQDEEGFEYVIICGNGERSAIDAAYLELVTPVEELEPFYVCENTESKSFEVRRKEDHKVQAAFYYFNEDDAHAKSEAAKATLEHCDRLNAENRKNQNNG